MVKRKKGLISTLFDIQELEELRGREVIEAIKLERQRQKRFARKLGFIFRTGKLGLGGLRRKDTLI